MQAPAHSIEHLRDQKEMPARNWSFHLFSSQFYLSVEKRELYSVRRNKGLVLPLVFNLRVFNTWYAPSPKRNACKELELPLLSSQLYLSLSLSLTFIVEKRELFFS